MSRAIIQAKGLTKRFGDFTAVDDLHLSVDPGSIFAFLGANGSGKSTTIRMLIGLLRPTSGSVEVDGIDVIREPRRVRDHIGYMGQKVSLYQGLSLRENVEFYAGLYGLGGTALAERWGALRERFELGSFEKDRSQDLSAGVRQRAGLAVATLHRPRVLFLDEPTAGVDVHNRGRFWELIQEEAETGVTVFVTTHFMEEADYCDWVSMIDRGKLVAHAPPEELRRRFSDGYRIDVTVPAAERTAVLERLAMGTDHAEMTPTGLRLRLPALGPEVLTGLERIARESPNARIEIAQPAMTDVFRRVLGVAGRALAGGER
jgi:drug efflux transport system ATP-binding protein